MGNSRPGTVAGEDLWASARPWPTFALQFEVAPSRTCGHNDKPVIPTPEYARWCKGRGGPPPGESFAADRGQLPFPFVTDLDGDARKSHAHLILQRLEPSGLPCRQEGGHDQGTESIFEALPCSDQHHSGRPRLLLFLFPGIWMAWRFGTASRSRWPGYADLHRCRHGHRSPGLHLPPQSPPDRAGQGNASGGDYSGFERWKDIE